MRIAFIGQKGIPALCGGIERHVEELAVRLVHAGHEVFVYCRPHYIKIKNQKSKTKNIYKGMQRIFLPSIPTKHLDTITHTFLATIHALFQNYDIIHFHGIGPSFLCFVPKMFGIKVVSTIHCLDWQQKKWGRLASWCLKLGEKMTVKFADKLIVVSKWLKKYCFDAYKKNVEYIPHGVKILNCKGDKEIRKLALFPQRYILTVGRLIPDRGIEYLIKAFNRLNTNLKLVIVGGSAHTDQYVKYLKRLAKDNPNIIFTGFMTGKSLAQLYTHAYLYVHPSSVEGLSLAILEAMAYGRCVLVSDIQANREAVSKFGFTFKAKDVVDLKNKLEFLLANPKLVKDTGQKAQQYVKESYNWDNIAEKTIKLYKSLLESSKYVLSSEEKRALREIKQALRGIRE